jgi:hypothetical protein
MPGNRVSRLSGAGQGQCREHRLSQAGNPQRRGQGRDPVDRLGRRLGHFFALWVLHRLRSGREPFPPPPCAKPRNCPSSSSRRRAGASMLRCCSSVTCRGTGTRPAGSSRRR